MAQYLGDQVQVGFFFTSGAYANPTGTTLQSFGLVQGNEIEETVNISKVRYAGTNDRNVGQFVTTTKDYTGALSYHPQDWKMLWFALGSVNDTSGTISTHAIREINSDDGNAYVTGGSSFPDFNIEDTHGVSGTKENSKRSLKGVKIESLTINGTQGEILTVDIDYVAQSAKFESGAASTHSVSSTVPFLFNDVIIHIPSGTVIEPKTDFTWSVTNEMLKRHYGNGSEVIAEPKPLNRDYEFSITLDEDTADRKIFYENYFQGGSTFNAMLQIGTAANRSMFIIMSGCRLSEDSVPSPNEKEISEEITIIPKNVSIDVNDTIPLYTVF